MPGGLYTGLCHGSGLDETVVELYAVTVSRIVIYKNNERNFKTRAVLATCIPTPAVRLTTA